MGTRGFFGFKKNGIISGYYNHYDSYYDCLGKKIVEIYFSCNERAKCRQEISNLNTNKELLMTMETNDAQNIFLSCGIYCEFGYVYDEDKDVLEIYRGFFEVPQWTEAYDDGGDHKKIYTHVVFTVDRNLNTKMQVYKAMLEYRKYQEHICAYPERKIINICDNCYKQIAQGERFCSDKCNSEFVARRV